MKKILLIAMTLIFLFGVPVSQAVNSLKRLYVPYLLLLSDSSAIPYLDTLTINEKVFDLDYNEGYQFTVTCLDQYGHPMDGLATQWSVQAGRGTINKNGYFMATRSGEVEIVAECNGIQGTLNITIGSSTIDTDGDGIYDWIEILLGTSKIDINDAPNEGSHYLYDDLGRIIRIVRIKGYEIIPE